MQRASRSPSGHRSTTLPPSRPWWRSLADSAAPKAANVLAAPFVLGDEAELARLFGDSGIAEASVT